MDPYVIFFCDDCDRLAPAIAAFQQVHPSVSVHTYSEPDALLDQLEIHKPEMILLYLHEPGKSYVNILKLIRENTEGNAIPLLVYHELPDAGTLARTFATFGNNRPDSLKH